MCVTITTPKLFHSFDFSPLCLFKHIALLVTLYFGLAANMCVTITMLKVFHSSSFGECLLQEEPLLNLNNKFGFVYFHCDVCRGKKWRNSPQQRNDIFLKLFHPSTFEKCLPSDNLLLLSDFFRIFLQNLFGFSSHFDTSRLVPKISPCEGFFDVQDKEMNWVF